MSNHYFSLIPSINPLFPKTNHDLSLGRQLQKHYGAWQGELQTKVADSAALWNRRKFSPPATPS
jgi:hypothetical protein